MEVNNRKDFEKVRTLKSFKGIVRSDSMDPFLKVGDEITVEVGTRDIRRFDLIVFWRDNQMMCHCLWSMNKFMVPIFLQSRCIRYFVEEYPIPIEDYLGKVTSHKLPLRYKLQMVYREMFRT